MSLLSSTLGFDAANDSQKAAKSQGNRNKVVAQGGVDLFNTALPFAQGIYGDLSHYNVGHAIGSALNDLNGGAQARSQNFAAGATENAGVNAQQQANLLKSQGFGDGAIGGSTQNLFQNAASQSNAYAAQQEDPDEQLKRFMAFLQALGGATSTANNAVSGPAGLVYGQPQQAVTPNPLTAILGQAAGAYSSAASKKAGS